MLSIFLKCLHVARIGRPDILWSVNKLARSITKWTKACDKRLSRLISYIHHTCHYKQYCHVGKTAKHCRMGLFQNSDFAGDLEASKFTSGGTLCIFGSHTFVPISWMCKKQTSVSHSSTESEIISLDAGFRMDGIPVLDLWDLVLEVSHSSLNHPSIQRNRCCTEQSGKRFKTKTRKHPNRDDLRLTNVEHVTSNAKLTHFLALLYRNTRKNIFFSFLNFFQFFSVCPFFHFSSFFIFSCFSFFLFFLFLIVFDHFFIFFFFFIVHFFHFYKFFLFFHFAVISW